MNWMVCFGSSFHILWKLNSKKNVLTFTNELEIANYIHAKLKWKKNNVIDFFCFEIENLTKSQKFADVWLIIYYSLFYLKRVSSVVTIGSVNYKSKKKNTKHCYVNIIYIHLGAGMNNYD